MIVQWENEMTIDEMLKVMQYYKDGGEIEFKCKEDGEWIKDRNPIWNFNDFSYRIKESPKTKIVYEWMMPHPHDYEDYYFFAGTEETLKLREDWEKAIKTGRQWEVNDVS